MPNWDNYLYDLAYWINWTIYVGAIVSCCMALVSIVVLIVYVAVTKIREYRTEHQFKKLDRKYIDGHSLEL